MIQLFITQLVCPPRKTRAMASMDIRLLSLVCLPAFLRAASHSYPADMKLGARTEEQLNKTCCRKTKQMLALWVLNDFTILNIT